jgi:hypothetical protein
MRLVVDGRSYSCVLADASERLEQADDFEREQYEVSPSGYGIHWPLLDEDLTVDGLLRLAKPEPRQSHADIQVRPGKLMTISEPHPSYGTRTSRLSKKNRT